VKNPATPTALKPGLTGSAEVTVGEADCATSFRSGSVQVFATPRMVALMEEAACRALEAALPPGQTSVGTRLEIEHLSATPVGRRVIAVAVLEWIDGRTLHFTVRAMEGAEQAGWRTYQRVLVDVARFLARIQDKK